MFNEKFLFSFLNLGDDMLFPDYTDARSVTLTLPSNTRISQEVTLEYPCLFYGSTTFAVGNRSAKVYINGQYISVSGPFWFNKGTKLQLREGDNFKGTQSATYVVFPLVKSGGGVRVSSYYIVSPKSKSKKENLCH